MKYLLALLLLISVSASAQYSPTATKTRFVNGIGLGTKDTTSMNAADTTAIIVGRDSLIYFRYKGFWKPLAYAGTTGITNIATNSGTGITGGPITSTGTIAADTLLLSTRAWRQKGVDSLNTLVNLRVKYTDTSTMLNPYLRKIDTTGKWLGVGYLPYLVKYTDTASMLSPYARSYSVVKYTDTASMLSPYYRTAQATAALALKLNISDTAAMLSPYARTTALGGYVPYTGATSNVNLGTKNIYANAIYTGFSAITASGTQVVLTVNSAPEILVSGSGGQTIKLPDATTLSNGTTYSFNNNQSSGAISVNNNSNTLIVSIPSGGYAEVVLLDNSIAAGSWDRHFQAPSNVSWSTNTFDYSGSITSATWNGSTIAINRGGTGATTASAALTNLGGLAISDTATMLSPYARAYSVVKYTDTASMLSPYYRTATATAALALKLNISDTATMLSSYYNKTVTDSKLALKVNYTDTSTMLSPYQRSFSAVKYTDTATMLSGYKTYYPRNAISAGTGISYNASTGVITNSSPSTGGTVTSVATNANTGITGGTITGSGTIAADTLLLDTRLWRQKGIDSVSQNVNLRVKYTDTATMLSPYQRAYSAVKYTDTATMLSPYLRSATGTATYQPLENQRLSTTNSPSFQTITTLAGGSNPLGKNISIGDDVFMADRNIANTLFLKGLPDSTKAFISFGGDANTLGYDGTKMSYSGSFTASSLIKSGGTSSQILAADGSVITAGTNITISGGTISASGGGSSGITSLNGLTATTQTFATGTSGSDFNISSATSTHTFNIPDASATARGLVTTGIQTIAGMKTFTATTIIGTPDGTTPGFVAPLQVNQSSFLGIDLHGTNTANRRAAFIFSNRNGGVYRSAFEFGTDVATNGTNDFYIYDNPVGAARFYISAVGNIGLGTTTPGSVLQVNGGAAIGYSSSTAAPTNGLAVSGAATFASSITASSLIKSGGTSAQILAADGSVITAGTNITISGGTISASGGSGSGITSLNGLTATTQTFATGTSGSDFNISSATSTHTFNIPDASASARGLVTTGTQIFAGVKSFTASATASGAIARGTYFNPTLTAAANGDILAAIDINPTFSTGAFTGVSSLAGRFNGNVVVGTVPSNISAFTFPPLTLSNNATGATKVQLALINGGGSVGAGSAIDFFTYTDQGNGNPGVRIVSTDDGVFSGNFQIQTKAQGGSGSGALSTKFTITGGSGAATFSSSVASTSFNSTTGGNFATSSGNIGIGTTTVGSKLQVNGNAAIGYSSSTAAPTNGLAVAGGVTIGTATNNVSSIAASGYSLSGANAQSLIDLSGTWNTTGNPTAIKLNVTNTASGATSNLMDLQVGGSSKFLVDKGGAVTNTGQVTITSTSGTVSGARNALYMKNAAASGGQSNTIVLGSAGTAKSWEIINDINADGTTINQLDIINAGTTRMSIASTGAITFGNLSGTGSRMVVADASGTLSAASIVTSGTYTPTAANYSNITSSTVYTAQYIRVGNVVTVSGKITPITTTAATLSYFTLSLPISSAFTAEEQAAGQGTLKSTQTSDVNAVIYAVNGNTVVQFKYYTALAGTSDMFYQFTYLIK